MFNFIKKIKDNLKKVDELQKEVDILKIENTKMFNYISDKHIYDAIGIPYVSILDKKTLLLIEARKRGYFEDNNYYVPIVNKNGTSYFKHRYSNIACNYRYHESDDSLYIPSIGVKDNFSAGVVCIYIKGEWAEIYKNI